MFGVILARLQPIHNGHIELVKKASTENDQVILFIGSADKFNSRNPIPINVRLELAKEALKEFKNVKIVPLDDLTTEDDNSHDWGFYLYSKVIEQINNPYFTLYYSDGYEIITSWFPGFILRNCISLNLLARNSVHDGVSATYVRNCIQYSDWDKLKTIVPNCVYETRISLQKYIEISKLIK